MPNTVYAKYVVWSVLFSGLFFTTDHRKIRYGDGAGNTIEENSSIFSLIRMH